MYFCSFISSYDVIFTADSDTIIQKFLEFDSKAVFSAEQFCWPDRSLAVRKDLKLINMVEIIKKN